MVGLRCCWGFFILASLSPAETSQLRRACAKSASNVQPNMTVALERIFLPVAGLPHTRRAKLSVKKQQQKTTARMC